MKHKTEYPDDPTLGYVAHAQLQEYAVGKHGYTTAEVQSTWDKVISIDMFKEAPSISYLGKFTVESGCTLVNADMLDRVFGTQLDERFDPVEFDIVAGFMTERAQALLGDEA